jgi:hypothetical protein
MVAPAQGDLGLLDDEAAQQLLASAVPAHLAYTWSDGTPRNTPIWFHWDGRAVVMCSPSNAPKVKVLDDGAPVAVTIHGPEWPFAVLLLRGNVEVDTVDGIAPEYRASATRYFGPEQGPAWCDSLPPGLSMTRFRLEPSWVGLLDFDGMRRLPSAIAG